ncbi:hypothetical protein AB1Y20_021310 [Prymnesium parvum]|uniref:Uncharacterized protein n=1 Tax=Prymnesium parvum TaxID=97485 RepID=A0AB34JKW7_PRYPA
MPSTMSPVRARKLDNSPYKDPDPQGLRYKSLIAERREYSSRLAASMTASRPQSATFRPQSATANKSKSQSKPRPWSAGPRPSEPVVAGGGAAVAAARRPTPMGGVVAINQATGNCTRSSYDLTQQGWQVDPEQRMMDRARERQFEKARASTAQLAEKLKNQERKTEWVQKQLVHCSQQLAQMRTLLVTVSEQRDAAYDAAEISAEETRVASDEASRLREENERLRQEVAELKGQPRELIRTYETGQAVRFSGVRSPRSSQENLVSTPPQEPSTEKEEEFDVGKLAAVWGEIFQEQQVQAAAMSEDVLKQAAAEVAAANPDAVDVNELLHAQQEFERFMAERKRERDSSFKLAVRLRQWLRRSQKRRAAESLFSGGQVEADDLGENADGDDQDVGLSQLLKQQSSRFMASANDDLDESGHDGSVGTAERPVEDILAGLSETPLAAEPEGQGGDSVAAFLGSAPDERAASKEEKTDRRPVSSMHKPNLKSKSMHSMSH